MKRFIRTCLVCDVGIIASYPLEILKVRKQTNESTIKLYKGVEAPLLFGGLANGIRLHVFNYLKSQSLFLALLFSGLIYGILHIPYERYKLSRQLGRNINYSGSEVIILREIFGTIIHFSLFSAFRSSNILLNIINSGGTAAVAMTIVFPLEVIFINYKNKGYSVIKTLKDENLWIGYPYNLLRTFIGYGISLSILSKLEQ